MNWDTFKSPLDSITSRSLSNLAADSMAQSVRERTIADSMRASLADLGVSRTLSNLAADSTAQSVRERTIADSMRPSLANLGVSRTLSNLAADSTAQSVRERTIADSMRQSLADLGVSRTLNNLAAANPPFDLSSRAARGFAAEALLADSTHRLIDQQREWERISLSSNSFSKTWDVQVPARVEAPNFADVIERAISARTEKDAQHHNEQYGLLSAIAEAGKKQNETMSLIANLQDVLIKEARENFRLQKTVMYFAALSAMLALIALLK